MTITISEVQEIIKNLEGGGELSIKEEKYLKVAKLCVQLAAENEALKSAVTKQIELRSEIKKAGRPPHADFWVQSICEAEDRVSKALNGTPATDRIVAGFKADGAEACVRALVTSDDDDFADAPNICAMVAYQLREGVDKC